jgi:hypothetical protein
MSQSYVIRVSASVKETVNAKDKRTKTIVLTGILPEAEQKEILEEKLKAQGWEEAEADSEGSGGKVLVRKRGQVTETLDLETMVVEATVELERTLERSRTITVRGDRDLENEGERREKEQTSLERSIAITDDERGEAETNMQRAIAEELECTDAERDEELNEAVREVYAESLKRKAASLGTITEVSESQAGDDYELVIKITE